MRGRKMNEEPAHAKTMRGKRQLEERRGIVQRSSQVPRMNKSLIHISAVPPSSSTHMVPSNLLKISTEEKFNKRKNKVI
jgi:hypothetical protein